MGDGKRAKTPMKTLKRLSSSEAFSSPHLKFSATVPEKSTFFCKTIATLFLRVLPKPEEPVYEVKDGSIEFENVDFAYSQKADKARSSARPLRPCFSECSYRSFLRLRHPL